MTDRHRVKMAGSQRVRMFFGRFGIYTGLVIFAVMMIFPFLYMFASALKTPADTFRYPPRVLPQQPTTVEFEGEAREAFDFDVDGDERRVLLVEEGIQAGLFADPADPEARFGWPLDLATETDATAVIDGESVPVYNVDLLDEVQSLALVRNTSVGRFVDPDSGFETYAVVRGVQEQAAEVITARWENFGEVLDLRNIDRALTNTALVTILVVAGQLFTSVMGGYAFARVRFPGRDSLFVAYLGSIMIPFVVLIIPLFQLMVGLGWIDHLGALVWPFVFTAYGTFLMRQFFVSIPKDLEEAAFIDGAKRWKVLWRVFVPLSWPAIATLATFAFLYAWNSFIWPLVAINPGNETDLVLTLALRVLGGQSVESPNLIFAGIALAVVVPMLVFIMAQRYFVENVATSGIK